MHQWHLHATVMFTQYRMQCVVLYSNFQPACRVSILLLGFRMIRMILGWIFFDASPAIRISQFDVEGAHTHSGSQGWRLTAAS